MGITEECPETESTYAGNAIAKARFYALRSGIPTVADDSGLEVDALDGRPGVETRRFAGPNATDEENNAKLLAELEGVAPADRTARYQCVLAFLDPTEAPGGDVSRGLVRQRMGTLEGRIARKPKGKGGFGYDPIFEPAGEPPGGRTFGLWSAAEKNRVSHRARAARRMAPVLRDLGFR